MEFFGEITTLDDVYIVGSETRTNNGENVFGELWQQFFKSYRGGTPIAVYADYDSDFRGDFTFVLGTICGEREATRIIKGGKFIKFHLGDRELIPALWQYIWASDLNRDYTADFEIYGEDGSVDVFIAIKE